MTEPTKRPRVKPGWPMSRLGWMFDDYVRRRDGGKPLNLSWLRCPSEPGLVSVILPVYNGERFVAEAIESILKQTYSNLELIAVDDGSTDSTPEILARFANADRRVRVIRQTNQRLPAALNAGHAAARGEFITWTSDDNRMKPGFIEYMVGGLRALPAVEMIYADYELIDETGARVRNSEFWERYQNPPGSGRLCLPEDVSLIYHGNFIGPAFLYRDRARLLLGDYNPRHFMCEDYDFLLRMNGWLTMRHAPGHEALYEYREHGASLTARREELKISERVETLMRRDRFRRDMTFYPICWIAESGPSARELYHFASGDVVLPAITRVERLPQKWFPSIFVHSTERPAEATPPRLPGGCLKVLIDAGRLPLPVSVSAEWDLCVTLQKPESLLKLEDGRRGWVSIQNIGSLIRGLRIRALADQTARMESLIDEHQAPPGDCDISVMIRTAGRAKSLERALESMSQQTLAPDRFEIIIVNNEPKEELAPLIDAFKDRFRNLRLVDLPVTGPSIARNAGLAEARGEWVLDIDENVVAEPDLLERVLEAGSDSAVGVVGGAVILEEPEKKPWWWSDEAAAHWGNRSGEAAKWRSTERPSPGECWAARRKALLEIGGFRCRYESGEDIVAALEIQKLGLKVVIEPKARARRVVHPSQPRFFDLFGMMLGRCRTELRLEHDLLIDDRTSARGVFMSALKHLGTALNPVRGDAGRRVYELFAAICWGWVGCGIMKMYFERIWRRGMD